MSLSTPAHTLQSLPIEIQQRILGYLIAPIEGVEVNHRRGPRESLFNIHLQILRVSNWLCELGRQIWTLDTYCTLNYPKRLGGSMDHPLKKVLNLSVCVKLNDLEYDGRTRSLSEGFVNACKDISRARDGPSSAGRLRSVKIKFIALQDNSMSREKLDVLCIGLHHGLVLLRADHVQLINTPKHMEHKIRMALGSRKPPMLQLPRMRSHLEAFSRDPHNHFEDADTIRGLVDRAVNSTTVKAFLRRRSICVKAMRLDETTKWMIYYYDPKSDCRAQYLHQ